MTAQPFTTRPELLGTRGMVAATHWLAATAGYTVLETGGNAADAAVTAAFVLQVVEPHLNGLGGDAPILVMGPRDAVPTVVCGQGPAPALATIEAFRAAGFAAVPGSGLAAAVVPGAFDAWMRLLRDRGTRTVAEVLEPAILYAEEGFPVVPRVSEAIAAVAPLFREAWPTSAELWLHGDRPPAPGGLHRVPLLAGTYRRLVGAAAGHERVDGIDAARRAFADGFVAAAVDAFVRTPLLDGSGTRHAGFLRGEDMAAWSATTEVPVSLDVLGHTVHKPGLWSQGPVLLQQLAMLEHLGPGDPGSAERVHRVVEVAKLAFADRDAWYGDSDEVHPVAIEDLLDPAYTAQRAALVSGTASSALRPGAPGGRTPAPLPGSGDHGAVRGATGEPTTGRLGAVRGDTCHVDVVDRDGLMVSATPSGGWLQSSPAIPGLGFCLGTRLQMTWLSPGLGSSLRPRRRPRTTLSPTLVSRNGRPFLACGTPGGDQQDQWQVPALLAWLFDGADLQAGIDAPTWHSNHVLSSFVPRVARTRELVAESRLGAEVLDDLRARGHDVVDAGPWALGRLSAVARTDDGILRAAANPRGMQGYAVGR